MTKDPLIELIADTIFFLFIAALVYVLFSLNVAQALFIAYAFCRLIPPSK